MPCPALEIGEPFVFCVLRTTRMLPHIGVIVRDFSPEFWHVSIRLDKDTIHYLSNQRELLIDDAEVVIQTVSVRVWAQETDTVTCPVGVPEWGRHELRLTIYPNIAHHVGLAVADIHGNVVPFTSR